MGRALKVSILAALLAAALLAFACGKSHVTGRGAIQAANSNSPQSLEDAQAQLDALACPEGVGAELWAQLKAALTVALDETTSSGTPRSLARLDDESKEPGWLARRTHKSTSTPPTGEANRVNDLAIADNGDGTYTLSWHYRNLGDYDQNGAVAVEDIIPLAQHFGEAWASGEENTLPAVIDGSGNGKIGVEDVTPIAANLGAIVDHYAIEGAQAQDCAWEAVAEVAQDAGAGDGRLAYEHVLNDTPFRWYHAVPADAASAPGVLSNAVFSPAFQEWVHTWGSSDTDEGIETIVDAQKNIYVVGGTGHYGLWEQDLLILKYSRSGSLLWQNSWDDAIDNTNVTAAGIAVDSSNCIFVAARAQSFDGIDKALLLKYSPEGELFWQKGVAVSESDYISGITISYNNDIYVTGNVNSSGEGPADVFLLKFNHEGEMLWQKTWGRDGYNFATSVCCDSSEGVYIAGHARALESAESGALVLKFSSDGALLWQKVWGATTEINATDVTVGWDSCIYLTGYTSMYEGDHFGDAFILKCSEDGTLIWQQIWGGDSQDSAFSIVANPNGNVYVAGYANGTSWDQSETFLCEYTAAGILQSQRMWHSVNWSIGRSIAIDSTGLLYLTGIAVNSFGAWETPALNSDSANSTLNDAIGVVGEPDVTQSDFGGLEEILSGFEDFGAGGNDVLILKVDPLRW